MSIVRHGEAEDDQDENGKRTTAEGVSLTSFLHRSLTLKPLLTAVFYLDISWGEIFSPQLPSFAQSARSVPRHPPGSLNFSSSGPEAG